MLVLQLADRHRRPVFTQARYQAPLELQGRDVAHAVPRAIGSVVELGFLLGDRCLAVQIQAQQPTPDVGLGGHHLVLPVPPDGRAVVILVSRSVIAAARGDEEVIGLPGRQPQMPGPMIGSGEARGPENRPPGLSVVWRCALCSIVLSFPALDFVAKVFRAFAPHHDRRRRALDTGVKEAIDPAPRLPAGEACGNVGECGSSLFMASLPSATWTSRSA